MTSSRRRISIRIVLLAAASSLAIAISGCATIPGSGDVEVGLSNLSQAEQFYQFTPSGPTDDASQEDLVRGFVLASSSHADDYAVAREFLTSDYTAQWDPYFGVLIDEGSRSYRTDGDTVGVLSLNATAKVDAAGQMLPVQPGAETDMRFEFERVEGQWRISSAPSGIILDKSTFMAIWSPHQLYFVGASAILVPETRWFIARAALATEIVGALVAGPSERMRESLHSGFPAGTSLITKSVPVLDGRARIDMSGELLEASPQALTEVRQQLKFSLQNVPGLNGYDLLVEGTELRDIPAGIEPRLVNEISAPAVLSGEQFGTIATGELTPVGGFANQIGQFDPTAITLSSTGDRAALLTGAGVILIGAEGSVVLDARQDLLAPAIDVFGYVWTTDVHGQVHALNGDGTVLPIAAPWLEGRAPVAVRLSPDGARIAVLVADDQGSQLLVAAVERDSEGVPLRTTNEADTELWATGAPVDFDWVGPTRFAVLSKSGNTSKVTVGGPGLFNAEQGSVPGGSSLSGGGARPQLRVLGGDNLFAPQGSGWQRIDIDVDVLAKRG